MIFRIVQDAVLRLQDRYTAVLAASRQLYLLDKEFATLGPFILVTPPRCEGLTHFWSALTVAREIGLSHLPSDEWELGV